MHFSWKLEVYSVAFLCSYSLNGIVSIVLHRKLKLLQSAEVTHQYCILEFISFWFSKQNWDNQLRFMKTAVSSQFSATVCVWVRWYILGLIVKLLKSVLSLSKNYFTTFICLKKIHELVFCALKWAKYSFEIWQFAFSSAKRTIRYIQFLAKGSFGKLAEKSYRTLCSMENIATKKFMLLKCLFMSFANPDLGCW